MLSNEKKNNASSIFWFQKNELTLNNPTSATGYVYTQISTNLDIEITASDFDSFPTKVRPKHELHGCPAEVYLPGPPQ
ncbi:uncharacterized protein MYCFIDRAFT_170550 [Pseudocercospora fijiensis CIRAD86]|uniref:Uncharacterized protein n=1 Tax=Pseudocercospora fijiensis (strain CIRAD86) TaxID=383855 RepID=N1QAR2_PSEFD|nr:uncharacterized protein MYCFIDRAFT_170550 [Pseudocercospora fijiensis CIRAD86]EME89016.1 hypothetical protein MYCFIDRAFT_170550 [Pseudocercospora fijiensis CIRAD86]